MTEAADMPRMGLRIGLVGFGAMGSVFADLLRAAGCRPLVFDIDPGAIERARTAGLDVAASPDEIA